MAVVDMAASSSGAASGGGLPAAVALDGLTRSFGSVQAVQSVTLQIPAGCVFGLLGPNGSGKTTLLSMIAGFIAPTAGALTLLGRRDAAAADSRRRSGMLVDRPIFWPYLSCRANLECLQGIYGTGGESGPGEVDTLLALVGLDGSLSRRKFRNCSTGMKQRLGIAAALLGDPPLLILDEPTNGLDPAGILEVRQLIRDLRGSGQTPRTIILASHLLYEVEQVCDQVGIMARGRLLYAGPVAEMSAPGAVFLRSTDDRRAETALAAAGWSVSESGNGLEVAAEAGDEWQVSRDLAAAGLYLSEMRAVGGTLEAGFMAVTGQGAGSPDAPTPSPSTVPSAPPGPSDAPANGGTQ